MLLIKIDESFHFKGQGQVPCYKEKKVCDLSKGGIGTLTRAPIEPLFSKESPIVVELFKMMSPRDGEDVRDHIKEKDDKMLEVCSLEEGES